MFHLVVGSKKEVVMRYSERNGVWIQNDIWVNCYPGEEIAGVVKNNKESVDRKCSALSCYEKSLEWAEIFNRENISGRVIQGSYKDENAYGEVQEIPHWYLEIQDGYQTLIFDPTASQFCSTGDTNRYRKSFGLPEWEISEYEDWKDRI